MVDSTAPALIVGYGPGVGAAVARALAREGHPLALVARSPDKLDAEVAALRLEGFDAEAFPADAGDPKALGEAISAARAALGVFGVLFYNAARARSGPVLNTTPDELAADFSVDVIGALAASRAVAPPMVERGEGALLFTGGGLALHPSSSAPTLSIGKASIRTLALMLAQELAPKGVRVGTVTIAGPVSPGTPFAPERIAEAFLELYRTPPDPATAEIVFKGNS